MKVARPQQTIRRSVEVAGVSFLAGRDVRIAFRPAGVDHGVVFARTDLPGSPTVPAHVRWAVPRQRRTTLQRGEAVVEMVEHVLAALAGLRVDNCLVEIDGPETPGCDGSSRDFAEALVEAGVVAQDAPRAVLAIERPVVVREGDAILAAYPGSDPDRLVLSYQLDYGEESPIRRQGYFAAIDPAGFRSEIAPARTFLLEGEAHALRQAGIGLRATERDLLIFGPDGVIGNELRFADEPSRHKLLDLLGDLALAGVDLAGHVVAHRSGHSLNAALAAKLLETHGASVEPASEDPRPPSARPTPAATPTSRRRAATVPAPEIPALPLEINDILRALPHRYPFLLVDRIVDLEPGVRAAGIKNVTYNEPFFQGHWPGRPIMPGVLIIEAMAQTAGVLIAQSGSTHRYALLVSVDGVKFRRPVVPGDQLRLEIDGVRTTGRATQVRATARVGDRVAAEGRIRFIAIDADRDRDHPAGPA